MSHRNVGTPLSDYTVLSFEVLTSVVVQIFVLWVVTPSRLLG
jgi:hypothetical protein